MLYWICPECGHECSPAIRECPTCTAAEKSAPSAETRREVAEHSGADILSLAETFQSPPAVGLLSPASYRNLISTVNGHSVPVSAAVLTAETTIEEPPPAEAAPAKGAIDSLVKPLVESAKQPEPAKQPALAKQLEPEAVSQLAPLDSLAVEPSRPARSEPVKPALSPVAPSSKAPRVVAAHGAQAQYSLKTAGLTPIGKITFQSATLRLPKAQEQEVEPAPPRRRSVAFVRRALPGAEIGGLAWADLTRQGAVSLTPVVSTTNGQPKAGDEISAVPLHPKAGSLAFATSRLALAGDSISDLLHVLETFAEAEKREAICAIHASLQAQPTELLLCAPHEIVTAPAPPAEKWLRGPKLVFTPHAPGHGGFGTLTAGPQAPTLAGPCLPPQLRNFTESSRLAHRPRNKRSAAPTWMVSVLVAMGLFVGAGGVLQYLAANRDAKAASVTPAAPQTGEPVLTPAPVAEEHPSARFVEVAGVRVVTTPNKKPQLQYIVVNHSASELTGLNIHIAVHSAESPTGPPLFRVSTVIPSLAANQSKEIRTDLDAGLKAESIPDWQSLRPEILIARQ
jgi:hypothetical protein